MLAQSLSPKVLTARVTIIHDPFDRHSHATTRVAVWDSRVGDFMPGGDWVCVLDGAVCTRDARVNPGSHLICYPRVGDSDIVKIVSGVVFPPLGAYYAIESGLTAAGAGDFSQYIAGVIFPQGWLANQKIVQPLMLAINGMPDAAVPVGLGNSQESSPTYGFNGIQNDMRDGAVIPVVYGTHRVGGAFISLFVRTGLAIPDAAMTGTVSVEATYGANTFRGLAKIVSGTADIIITGSGTNFLSVVAPTDVVMVGGYRFTVVSIASDTSMIAHSADGLFIPPMSGAAWTVVHNYSSTGNNDVLFALLALSEGEIDSISDIQINNQPLANYKSVVVETSMGTNTQSPPAVFGDSTIETVAADAVITPEWLSYQTLRTNITAFEINLLASSLFAANDQGGIIGASVTFMVEYQVVGAGSWTALDPITIGDARRSAVRRVIRVEGLTPGQYNIRIRRTTLESTSLKMVDSFHRTSINEIVNDAHSYPNVAWLATRILASDQLSGGRPTITAVVRGRKVRIFSSATQYSIAWSDNPSWCVLDLLLHMRYGGGQFVAPVKTNVGTITLTTGSAIVNGDGTSWAGKVLPGMQLFVDADGRVATVQQVNSDTQLQLTANYAGSGGSGLAYEIRRPDVDLTSFVDWAEFCDTLVDDGNGGTEKRATVNIVLDSNGSVLWDVIGKVAAVGFGALIKAGNSVKAKWHQAEPSTQLFSMANVVKGSFNERFLPLRDRNNYFEIQYLDAARDYAQAVVSWQDPLILTNEDSERRMTVSAYGCTRTSHANRLSTFYALTNRYLTRTIDFQAGLNAVICEPGDIIDLQHDVPQWGFGSRVAALAEGEDENTSVTLDHPMTVEAGYTYQIAVQHADGTRELHAINDGAGTYTTLHLDTVSWTTVPAVGEVVAFGKVNILVKPFRVLSLKRTPEMNVAITAIEYDERIYDETQLGTLVPIPYSALPDPSAPPSHVTDLAVEQLEGGTVLWVSFTPPTEANYATSYIYRVVAGVYTKVAESRTGGVELRGYHHGDVVTIAAVSVSTAGVIANLATAPMVTVVMQNTMALPPRVTGLELAGQGNYTVFTGKDAKFRWRDRSVLSGIGQELLGYETLGFGAGGSDSTFRDYRVEIYSADGSTFRRRVFVVDPEFTYTHEMNHEDGVVRSFMIRVWQRDMFNQLSDLPAELTVSNPSPAVPDNLTVVPAFGAVLVQYDPSEDTDSAGYRIWMSTTEGFTPGDDTLVYEGPDTYKALQIDTPGVPYYVRMAAFDTFGTEGLAQSSQYSVTPLNLADIVAELPSGSITQTMIADDSIDTPKLRAGAVTSDKVTSGQLITLAAQIANAIIGNAHISELDAGKLRAGSITADKIALTLWGDLSQAMAYASDLLSGMPDFSHIFSAAEVDTGSFINCVRDKGQLLPTISLQMTRRWDDGLGSWWDTAPFKWDEPVTTELASWQTPIYDLGQAMTGKTECWLQWVPEVPATAVVAVKATYQKDGSTQWGTNYPDYNNGGYETLSILGLQGGVRSRYVSVINAAVRKVRVKVEFTSGSTNDRISAVQPEIRFNDTRIQADKLNILTALTATAGGGATLPGTVLGFFKMQLPDGTDVRVPYYAP